MSSPADLSLHLNGSTFRSIFQKNQLLDPLESRFNGVPDRRR
jgi:hypothetical protein